MKLLLKVGLVALYTAGALAACNPTIEYFPTAQELQPGFNVSIFKRYEGNETITEVCNGTQVCNSPVWQRASQDAAATKAVNVNLNSGLLMVVLPSDRDSTLYFKVVSDLLVESNSTKIDDCVAVPATRKLLSPANGTHNNVTVTKAGTIAYTIKVDDESNGTAGAVIGTAGGKLVVPKNSPEGKHCAEIAVTITGYELKDGADNTGITLTTAAKGVTSKKICWYKPGADKATAQVELETPTMCDVTKTDADMKINVNISGVTPSYVALQQHTEDLTVPLLQPVIHIFGRRVAALDNTLDTAEYDANGAANKNFVNEYILLPKNFTADSSKLVTLQAAELEEGYYNITAKVFVMSNFKDLLGFPATPIAQTEKDEVKNQVEIMTKDLFKDARVALQKSQTTLSAISSDRKGEPVKANDDIVFTWTFVGAPSAQTCKHGDEAAKPCTSPYTVKAKDVTGGKKVDFVVTFTDVCNSEKKAEFAYTAAGVTALSTVDTPAAGGGVVKLPPKNAAGAATPRGFLVTAAMSLLMAAFL